MAAFREFDVEQGDARLEAGHGPLRETHGDAGGQAPRVEHAAQALHERIRLGPAHVCVQKHIHQRAARAQGAAQLDELRLDGMLRTIVGRGVSTRLFRALGDGLDRLTGRFQWRNDFLDGRCGGSLQLNSAERGGRGATRGEASGIGADGCHRLAVVEVERNAGQAGSAVCVSPRDNRDLVARHQVARVEVRPQRVHDRIHGLPVDAVAVQDAADRLTAAHGHGAPVTLERDLGERDGLGEGDTGAPRAVAALRRTGRLDVPSRPRLDADRDRNASALAIRPEQDPYLAADRHTPQIRSLLDRLDDPVGVDGAHAGSVQQDGKAIAAPEAEGLQLGLGFDRGERVLQRHGQGHGNCRDEHEHRNSAYPTARASIHTSNQSP